MIELFLGIVFGLLSGLLPGLHPNTIALFFEDPIFVAALLPAYALASLVPTLFLSFPAPHVIALQKREYFLTTLFAALLAFFVSLLFLPLLDMVFIDLYYLISPYLLFVLVAISFILVLSDNQPVLALLLFLLSGLLGQITFTASLQEPFLPLFGGLFFVFSSNLSKISSKDAERIYYHSFSVIPIAVLFGFLSMFLPAIGSPSQIAILLSLILPLSSPAFYVANISISMSQIVFSFLTFDVVDAARVGAIVYSQPFFTEEILISLSISAVFSFLALYLLKSVDFSKLLPLAYIYLILANFIFNGLGGFIYLGMAIAVNLLCKHFKVRRINLMGSIILPTIFLMW